jgi:hypothetical protein
VGPACASPGGLTDLTHKDALQPRPDGQKRVDAVQRALRTGAAPPAELAGLVRPTPGDPQVPVLRVLAALGETVEALGAELVDDPDILARHVGALQSLDVISQSLAALAGLITADQDSFAAASVTLARLRARLSGS